MDETRRSWRETADATPPLGEVELDELWRRYEEAADEAWLAAGRCEHPNITPREFRRLLLEVERDRLHAAERPPKGVQLPTRVWLLSPRPEIARQPLSPFAPHEEKVQQLVVRAETETQARLLAQQRADELEAIIEPLPAQRLRVWQDRRLSLCVDAGIGPAAVVTLEFADR